MVSVGTVGGCSRLSEKRPIIREYSRRIKNKNVNAERMAERMK